MIVSRRVLCSLCSAVTDRGELGHNKGRVKVKVKVKVSSDVGILGRANGHKDSPSDLIDITRVILRVIVR